MRNSLRLELHRLPEYALDINKKGLYGYPLTVLSSVDKKLISATERMMSYRGQNDVDTINHMCDFLFNIEKRGETGFIIESLIDQSNIRPLNEAYQQAKDMNHIVKLNREMHNFGLAHVYLALNGHRYGYSIVSSKMIDLRPLTVNYMELTLYTFIQMMRFITPSSTKPTDADDIISDLAFNQPD